MEEARQYSALTKLLLKAWWGGVLDAPFDGYAQGVKEFEYHPDADPEPIDEIKIEFLRELCGFYTFFGLELIASVDAESGVSDGVMLQRRALAGLSFSFSGHVQSILMLLEMGFDSQARVLVRTVIEILEYMFLIVDDGSCPNKWCSSSLA